MKIVSEKSVLDDRAKVNFSEQRHKVDGKTADLVCSGAHINLNGDYLCRLCCNRMIYSDD